MINNVVLVVVDMFVVDRNNKSCVRKSIFGKQRRMYYNVTSNLFSVAKGTCLYSAIYVDQNVNPGWHSCKAAVSNQLCTHCM